VDGYNKAQGAETPEPPSDDRFEEMLAELEEQKVNA
jgi:hypothetical protein